MPGTRCTVCDHPERKAIEVALVASSERRIAKQWSISDSAVHRHKTRHLKPAVARAIATRTDFSAAALVQRLADLLGRCDRAMGKAEDAADLKTLGGLIRESRELVVTVGRTIGLWTDKPATIIDARRQTLNLAVGELSDAQLRALVQRAAAIEVSDEPALGASA
jgi:hypothetical protein